MAASIEAWANALYAVVALAVYVGVLAWYYRRQIGAWLRDLIERDRQRREETLILNRMWGDA